MLKNSVDWKTRQGSLARRMLNSIERINLALESPFNRLVGDPRYNPFYHTGTISVFLLLVILFTGIYLSLFYPFGFNAAYATIARVEANPIGRIIRALHRYASAAALLTSLLHGWRTFFMDRFRGARWLAWVTGIIMVAAVWFAGITGYWLIWDVRAQSISDGLVRLVLSWPAALGFLLDNLLTPRAGTGWFFVLLMEITHVLMGLAIILFFIYHIRRLSRAKINPPRYWMGGLLLLLVLAAAFFPAGMLPPGDLGQLPGAFPIDIFFLFYLPASLNNPVGVWVAIVLVVVVSALVPWLIRRKPLKPVSINGPRCTGCTLCSADCPYKALKMVERTDGLPHKFVALLDPELCVSCGICIGSCPTLAISLGDQPPEAVWEQTVAQAAARSEKPISVVFACERHAFQGAHAHIDASGSLKFPMDAGEAGRLAHEVRIVPLTCIGMAHPDLVERALSAGADEVRFVGCPPEDCANREGNLWVQHRLERRRLPRLRLEPAKAPVFSSWAAPNDFWRAVEGKLPPVVASAYENIPANRLSWQKFAPAILLMAIILGVQLWLTNVSVQPYPTSQGLVEISIEHRPGQPLKSNGQVEPVLEADSTLQLFVNMDGNPALSQSFGAISAGQIVGLARLAVTPGIHQLKIEIAGEGNRLTVFDQQVAISARQIWRLPIEDAKIKGDPVMGERLFNDQVFGARAGCTICHSLDPNQLKAGPSLAGVATRAASRVPGLSAEAYLRQSILEPNAYVVEGYPSGQMPANFKTLLSDSQVQDIVAFLLTLK